MVGSAPQYAGSSTAAWIWSNHEYISNGRPTTTNAPTGQHLTFARFLAAKGILTNDVDADVWPQGAVNIYTEQFKRQLGGSWFRVVQDPATLEWSVDTSALAHRYDSSSDTLTTVTGFQLHALDHDDLGNTLPAGVVAGIAGDCSGGISPWGTVVTAEENVQAYYGDLESSWTSSGRFIPGAGFDAGAPIDPPYLASPFALYTFHSFFGQRHNRDNYGFLTEIDPGFLSDNYYESAASGGDGAGHRKIGSMGRARWENCTFHTDADWKLVDGKPVTIYAANDRRGGRIYKWRSDAPYQAGMTKAQVRALLDTGKLYVAHFAGLDNKTGDRLASTGEIPTVDKPGAGQWLELSLSSADVAPNADALGAPGTTIAQALQDANWNGIGLFTSDNDVLAALYTAANKIGVMELNRPEDLEWNPKDPSGSPLLYVAFTKHGRQVALTQEGVRYQTSEGEFSYWTPERCAEAGLEVGEECTHSVLSPRRPDPYGSIFVMNETDPDNPATSTTFEYYAAFVGTGGQGPFDVANPDNAMIDNDGGVWFGTDGNFGVNGTADALYYLDLNPAHKEGEPGVEMPTYGMAFRVAAGPDDSESTGPAFSANSSSLFFNIQHPGESSRSNSSWPAEGFELSLEKPDDIETTPNSTLVFSSTAMLTHSGDGSGAEAWSYGVQSDLATVIAIDFFDSEAGAIALASEGFAVHELTADGGAVAAVVLDIFDPMTLGRNQQASIATVWFETEIGAALPDSISLDFAGGLVGSGLPVALNVSQNSEDFLPKTVGTTVDLIADFIPRFTRADVDGNGSVAMADAVRTFRHLFQGSPATIDCGDAADSNDDGTVDLADGVLTLNVLFLGLGSIPPPYPECGIDETEDLLECISADVCVD